MIRYLDAFSDLNPLEDELPFSDFDPCLYVVQEAKALLPNDFDIVDLNAGLEILMQLRGNESAAIAEARPEATSFRYTPPLGYFLSSESVELPERPNGEMFRWSEVFAVAALGAVADLATFSIEPKVYDPNLDEFQRALEHSEEGQRLGYLDQLPMEAMESLGFSRLFGEREKFELEAAAREQRRSKSVSKRKLQTYHEVKLAIVSRFNELRRKDGGLSVRKMARVIYDGLESNLKATIASEDPQQQIESWLGKYKKGTLPGQERLPPYEA